jgi:hypothetical protein
LCVCGFLCLSPANSLQRLLPTGEQCGSCQVKVDHAPAHAPAGSASAILVHSSVLQLDLDVLRVRTSILKYDMQRPEVSQTVPWPRRRYSIDASHPRFSLTCIVVALIQGTRSVPQPQRANGAQLGRCRMDGRSSGCSTVPTIRTCSTALSTWLAYSALEVSMGSAESCRISLFFGIFAGSYYLGAAHPRCPFLDGGCELF